MNGFRNLFGTLITLKVVAHFLRLWEAQRMNVELAGLYYAWITLHLTIYLSLVKQKSHLGCNSFINAFSTSFPITSFSSIS